MIRVTFTAAVLALATPAMAQLIVDPVVVADKACAALNNPSMPQTVKDEMRERIYGPLAGPLPAGATDDFKAMWEGYALVRERGCGKP
jgi:hypothetical protein